MYMSEFIGLYGVALLLATLAASLALNILFRMIAQNIRQSSETTWRLLGAPEMTFYESMTPAGFVAQWALASFVYFSGEHRALGDPWLSRLVWVVRALAITVLGFWMYVCSRPIS